MLEVEQRNKILRDPYNISFAAIIVVIIGALVLTFALAVIELVRAIVFDYLGVERTLVGQLIHTIITFIIIAFVIVLISIYHPLIIEKAIY